MTKPKPKQLYNPASDPANKRELTPDEKLKASSLRPPYEITKEQRKYWKRYAPELAKLHVITESDKAALLLLCRASVMYDQAAADIERYGTLTNSDKGALVRNPSLLTMEKAQIQVMTLLKQFGMTPATRHNVSTVAADDDEQNGFDSF